MHKNQTGDRLWIAMEQYSYGGRVMMWGFVGELCLPCIRMKMGSKSEAMLSADMVFFPISAISKHF